MVRANEELRELVITDPAHRDQAALLLLYAMNPSEEDLLAVVLHVLFLRRNAAERLLASTPREDTLWQIVHGVPALQEHAERMLFEHYPSRANLVRLLHPTRDVWNADAAELLLASNPSRQELQAIIENIPDTTVPPWKGYYEQARQMLTS